MKIWDSFVYFAVVSAFLWVVGAAFAWCGRQRRACVSTVAGLSVFLVYIMLLWWSLERPPLRTMGETRLWYSFFLPLSGLMVYVRWHYKWIMSFSALMSVVFICVNILKPEIHSKALMPSLQSVWFAPHVIVYMLSYALLGAAALMALFQLWRRDDHVLAAIDELVCVGMAFLTTGMLFGALWAKEAWGHYWSWDPKETWAAITWLGYLCYIHYRLLPSHKRGVALCMVVLSFVLLQVTWWGVNYLPSAKGTSVHTYSSSSE